MIRLPCDKGLITGVVMAPRGKNKATGWPTGIRSTERFGGRRVTESRRSLGLPLLQRRVEPQKLPG